MPTSLTGNRAKSRLDEYVSAWHQDLVRSSSGKPGAIAPVERGTRRHWEELEWNNQPFKPGLQNAPRSIALLLAYAEIGSGIIEGRGICCSDGLYIKPDQQVMNAFFKTGLVEFLEDDKPKNGYFVLTTNGRRAIGLMPRGED